MPRQVYLGIDLGGTRIRAGRFTEDLTLQARTEALTLDEEGVDAVIGRMVSQARGVWAEADQEVVAVGVSAPGPVDIRSGILTRPPNLKGWHNVALKRRLQDALGVPVFLGNDANLAALAEYQRGAGKGYDHVVYITVSTGIGVGVISDGNMIVGVRGFGAEGGHLPLVIQECGRERVTTVEKEAQGGAIANQARAILAGGEESDILAMAGGDLMNVQTRHVVEAARQSDQVGLRVITRAGKIIGLCVVSLLHLFNPEIVIIGGGVAEGAGDLLLTPVWQAIRENVLDESYYDELKIVPPLLGEDVSLVGAATLALRGGK